ncbi:peptide deformylase [Candidatus Bipolaricaulota bacterium]|nr:peptide deformylase [Candidatus Bipolaricaulota bacterium]
MILLYPDRALRRRAKEVEPQSPAARTAAQRLREAFSQVEGLGLAANQVGLLHRVILVRLGEEERILLNPRVIWRSEELELESEACLSIPGVEADLARPKEVRVRALLEDGKEVDLSLEGLEARLLLHEIDHLDGVLYLDHLSAGERRRLLREYRRLRSQRDEDKSLAHSV